MSTIPTKSQPICSKPSEAFSARRNSPRFRERVEILTTASFENGLRIGPFSIFKISSDLSDATTRRASGGDIDFPLAVRRTSVPLFRIAR